MKKFTLFLALVLTATFVHAQMPYRASKLDIMNMAQTSTPFDSMSPLIKTTKTAKAHNAQNNAKAPNFDPSTIITEQPEGEVKTYERGGGAFILFYGNVSLTSQAGISIEVTYAPDGKTVYFKNIMSQALTDTWVKGTKEGNKIHLPMNQMVLYEPSQKLGIAISKLDFSTETDESGEPVGTYVPDFSTEEMTFTINEENGVISLDGTDIPDGEDLPDTILGFIYTSNNGWAGYGDFQSVYMPMSAVKTEIPETLNIEDWSYTYYDQDGNRTGNIVKVAIDGDKMYIAGLCKYDPTSAIVGTINGDKVTFKSDQFMCEYRGYLMFACGAKGSYDEFEMFGEIYRDWTYEYLPEFTYTYDTDNKTITSADDDVFIINGGKGSLAINDFITGANPTFNYFADVPATPADPEITEIHDSNYEEDGFNYVRTNIKTEDVDGNFINPDNIKYIFYTKIDEDVEPYIFYADEYYSFKEQGIDELTEVPYNFTAFDKDDKIDIALGGATIYYYQNGFDDYGLQTIYYGGGERRESNIAWYSVTSGIKGVTGNKAENAITAIYSIDGKRLATPQKGLNIMKMADGKVRKVITK